MVYKRIIGALICASVLWAGCSGSQSGNGSNADKSAVANESKPATTEDLWKSYLKSDYCDVASINADAAVKLLEKKSATVSKLIIDPVEHVAVDEKTLLPSSENEDIGDTPLGWYHEQMGSYAIKDGGTMVLVFSEYPGIGRQTLQMFKYDNGSLTRLKNQFPEFSNNMALSDFDRFEDDKFVNFKQSEVFYFESVIFEITDNGFNVKPLDSQRYTFKWNGKSFE
ncbi:MAG: hypothetical protein IKP73_19880 [Bacteroidales bacterium]|nr:hypothetical protein [Bacteroidales bacterium]